MQVEIFPRSVLLEREGLAARAQEILGQNDMGGVDEGGVGPLSPPVELGQRIHRHRAGAPRYPSRHPRAAHAFSASVENRQGSPHRLQSRDPPDSYFPGAEHWACAAASP